MTMSYGGSDAPPRLLRGLLNKPFQSSIRALMLLHAAWTARCCACGEFATRFASSSRPQGAMTVAIEFECADRCNR